MRGKDLGEEELPELSPMLKSKPASSRVDRPLAKAKPVSESGSNAGIVCLRRGKECCATAAAGEERKHVTENPSADIYVSAEGGTGGAAGSREIPLQPVVKTECPCAPAAIYTMLEQVAAQRKLTL